MKAPDIVILTGAGISAESGIKTFRASDGLWENHRVEDVATPEGFRRNPSMVQRFYNERRRHLFSPEVKPNPAHKALGILEREYPGNVAVVTQNIDNLHERGGSRNVIHMHGTLLKGFCIKCLKHFDVQEDMSVSDTCQSCGKSGTLRPDIVWFGEIPYEMDKIQTLMSKCGIFISVGTSGNVYPAAGFVSMAGAVGARTIEVNLEPSKVENSFQEHRYGMAGTLVPQLVDEILGKA